MKELKCDYSLDFVRSRWYWFFPRTKQRLNRWVVMDSPKWIQRRLHKWYPQWYSENLLFYILAEEIQKEIDNQIISELEKALKNESSSNP
jgi:hypothetical protein